jgi:hypothetical protein
MVSKINEHDYKTGGQTALFDGVDLACDTLDKWLKVHDGRGDECSCLVLVITDGEENYSRQSPSRVADRMSRLQKNGNWSFVFLLPEFLVRNFIKEFSVSSDNVRGWEQSERGMREAREVTSGSLDNYYTNVSRGTKSTTTFFVKTDLSKVTQKAVHTLQDVTSDFRIITVKQEGQIKPLVEEYTNKDYVIGSTYYQLMKKETIQPNKQVMLYDKSTKKLWAGNKVRPMIGLIDGGYNKVDPFNHGSYDIFVESNSVNRKVPSGTKLAIAK